MAIEQIHFDQRMLFRHFPEEEEINNQIKLANDHTRSLLPVGPLDITPKGIPEGYSKVTLFVRNDKDDNGEQDGKGMVVETNLTDSKSVGFVLDSSDQTELPLKYIGPEDPMYCTIVEEPNACFYIEDVFFYTPGPSPQE